MWFHRILRPAQPLWYSIMIMVGGLGVLVASGMFYTRYTVHRSELKLCAIVVTMDQSYRANPPRTDTGRMLAERMAQLRRDLGCPADIDIN